MLSPPHKYILFYFLFSLIVKTTPFKIRSFDNEGCEIVHYPPEILAPIPHLKECLSTINGLAVYPGDPDYYDSIKVFNCRNSYFPIVIIYVTKISDIQRSIHCANTLNITVVPRSGGHSFEEYGIGGKNGVMVIDVKEFNQITINVETNTAIIGPGNRLGTIYHELYQAGFLIPAGLFPQVGIGGHATGGGYGAVTRKYGMSCDNIIGIEMVTANGTFISPINSTHHSDLFFVLRGAGNAGYGIVTSLTFRIHPIPPIVTSIRISYTSEQIELGFLTFTQTFKNLNENLTPFINLSPNTLLFIATYLGPEEEARNAVKELIELSNPTYVKFEEMSWWSSVILFPYVPRQNFKSTSYVIPTQGLSLEGFRVLLNFISDIECNFGVIFDVCVGGVLNKISVNSSAFIHRDFFAIMQLELMWSNSKKIQTKCLEKQLRFSQEFQAKYTTYFSYQNYIDRDLDDWGTRYYGHHLPRLVETKKKYDPNNLFNWAQSIPTKLP
ncbi:Glucooligosaccharide oxidase [Gigaspora rosea]|uniref:Glucooligosaccharide oxidase n=1 Tax=Gigaspora rosea TaxID=44941 RepID=A0A397UX87_9GLOM|nr:Glucooligosaccharide oxidase [Gigaspora rosea]